MGEHKCVIGLFNQYECSYLCNLDDLKRQIQDKNEFVNSLLADPIYGKIGNPGVKLYTECGKRIDWAALKEER